MSAKLPILKAREVAKILEELGFGLKRQKGLISLVISEEYVMGTPRDW